MVTQLIYLVLEDHQTCRIPWTSDAELKDFLFRGRERLETEYIVWFTCFYRHYIQMIPKSLFQLLKKKNMMAIAVTKQVASTFGHRPKKQLCSISSAAARRAAFPPTCELNGLPMTRLVKTQPTRLPSMKQNTFSATLIRFLINRTHMFTLGSAHGKQMQPIDRAPLKTQREPECLELELCRQRLNRNQFPDLTAAAVKDEVLVSDQE